jgi:hypothetical protein
LFTATSTAAQSTSGGWGRDAIWISGTRAG